MVYIPWISLAILSLAIASVLNTKGIVQLESRIEKLERSER